MVFVVLTLGMVGLTLGLPMLFRGMSRVVPENYIYLATEAMKSGNHGRAQRILESRINKEWYDFTAHYLLAQAQEQAGEPAKAAQTMRDVLAKAIAIRGRVRAEQAGYAGYDEAKTVQLLARYLWQSGRHGAAAEAWRHAMDLGSSVAYEDARGLPHPDGNSSLGEALAVGMLALRTGDGDLVGKAVSRLAEFGPSGSDLSAHIRARWLEERDHATTTAQALLITAIQSGPAFIPALSLSQMLQRHPPAQENTSQILSLALSDSGVRPVALSNLTLPNGASMDGGSLRMTRNGKVAGRVDSGMFQSNRILVATQATEAFGQWPVLVVRVNGEEVSRLYLDGLQPGLRVLGPWPDGLPKLVDLELEFINDAFDPITRSDRDIRILGIWFQ
jgi:tetratricopeptide (TPR) repeat protein